MRARSWIASLGVAGLVTSTVLVASAATSASATINLQPPGPGTSASNGQIRITDVLNKQSKPTGTFNVTFTPSNGPTSTTTQTIQPSKTCALDTTQPQTYLGLSATTGNTLNGSGVATGGSGTSVGDGSQGDLGVDSEGSGAACYQVNQNGSQGTNEVLSLQVNGSAISNLTTTGGMGAGFDLNLTGSVIVQAVFYRNGVDIGGAEFQSGLSGAAPVNPARPNDQLEYCNDGQQNSGPQNGTTNECYWTIQPLTYVNPPTPASNGMILQGGLKKPGDGVWDRVDLFTTSYTIGSVLYPAKNNTTPSFSLEGGQQWQGYTGSYPLPYHTYSYIGTAAEYQNTSTCGTTDNVTNGANSVTYTRVDNYDSTTCKQKAYTASLSSNDVFSLQADPNADPSATWSLQFQSDYTTPTTTDPTLYADFSNGTVSGAKRAVGDCPASAFSYPSYALNQSFAYEQQTGLVDSSNNPLTEWNYRSTPTAPVANPTLVTSGNSTYDWDPTTPGAQYACIYASTSELVTVNGQQVQRWIDWVMLYGDVLMGKY